MEQRFTFNDVATLYDEARPGYPTALFDDIAVAAALNAEDAILEIGCGTGIATRGFATKGSRVVALDPGRDLIDIARRSLGAFSHLDFVETTFEAWPLQSAAFQLVAAAQSWHWVAPDTGFRKAAACLVPGGHFAMFGNVPVSISAHLREDFRSIYLTHAPALVGPPPEVGYLPGGFMEKQLRDAADFGPVTHRAYAWSRELNARAYTDWLGTRSEHRLLAPEQRDTLLAAIADAIDAQGGKLELGYQTHLYMAQRT